MKTANQKSYFPGLNALRFVAASLVIFHHIEQYKHWAGMDNAWGLPVIDSLGHMSVSFFFVLSGFLITYLLLSEIASKGRIQLVKFYMRRVLRIWPLYFLIVAVAGVLYPMFSSGVFSSVDHGFGLSVVLCFFLFVPNILRIINPGIVGANQLWSVGIEEQFYAFWPLLVGAFSRNIKTFLVAFIVIKLLVHAGLTMLDASLHSAALEKALRLYTLFPIEQMAIGGLGAALLYERSRLIDVIRHWSIFMIAIVGISVLAFFHTEGLYWTYVEAMLFIIVQLNVIYHRAIYSRLESKLLIHLGNISYGIYMWHTVVVALMISAMSAMDINLTAVMNLVLYVSSFAGTLFVAHLSFKYFETPFLKWKDQFSPDSWKIKRSTA